MDQLHGLHDIPVLEEIGRVLGLHPLVVEDVAATDQRPKLEDLGGYVFIVINRLSYNPDADEIISRQVSLLMARNWVITFQEAEEGAFHPVRDRIKAGTGRTRASGADYLVYALIDALVDHYFVTLELIEDDMELMEEQVVTHPGPEVLQFVHKLKTSLMHPAQVGVAAAGNGLGP